MKRLGLLIYLSIITILFGCESNTIPMASPNLVSSISTRGSNEIASIPSNSLALFNASGGTNIENQIFKYNGNYWESINGAQWQPSTTSTTLTALYPAYNGNDLITENPYTSHGLEDVLIAQSSFTNEKDICLTFRHLFSMFTIHIQSPLRESITGLSLQTPQIEKLNVDGSFSLSGMYQSIPELNTSGDYTFIIPSMENCNLLLSFNIGEKTVSHTLTHTFESGYKYECNVTDQKKPGIYNTEDWIEFSKIINNKIKGDLSKYGELQDDGRWIYRLWADIDFSNANSSELLPIGYDEGASVVFSGTFDGQGHTISNLTLPDISINNNVRTNYSGLFGYISNQGVVKNLHLINAQTVNSPSCKNVGGIAARNEGIIQDCSVQYSNLTSASSGYVGGICSINNSNGYIVNCKSTDNTITASKLSSVGGIIGGYCGKILNCYTYDNSFDIKTEDGYAGGIVGSISASYILEISNCYVKHTKKFGQKWGAIIGLPQKNKFTFKNVFYNGGNIIANNTTSYTDVYLYENFSVGENHISVLLNQWIEDIDKSHYPNVTFRNWTINTEITPNPAVFIE